MRLELLGKPTEQLYAALTAGISEPTRSTMDPVDFARPRWRAVIPLLLLTGICSFGLWWAVATTIHSAQVASEYQKAAICDPGGALADCRKLAPATIEQISSKPRSHLWESDRQHLFLRLTDQATVEARFGGTPSWMISVGEPVDAEIWRDRVTQVRAADRTERTAINPIVEADSDRSSIWIAIAFTLGLGLATVVAAAKAARYKPLSDYFFTP